LKLTFRSLFFSFSPDSLIHLARFTKSNKGIHHRQKIQTAVLNVYALKMTVFLFLLKLFTEVFALLFFSLIFFSIHREIPLLFTLKYIHPQMPPYRFYQQAQNRLM